ncbi:methyltransferase [Candidatus Woesearchaeota archaeon]|nr:methyltransferase [Candidatus Woesearchaeota archaeon]
MVYEPLEDSELLAQQVNILARGKVLDMGTGSGVQALSATKNKSVNSVLAVDIDKKAISHAKKHNSHKKIEYAQSDMFKNIKGQFDTIIFNPPYLPNDELAEPDVALDGGPKGWEVSKKFLDNASDYLADDGQILFLFSNQTKKNKVESIIAENGFEKKQLTKKTQFFETLYVYQLTKNQHLKTLNQKKVSNVMLFARGHRGLIYTGVYKNKKIAAKFHNPISKVDTITNEITQLTMLKKKNIGPKIVFSGKNYFVYWFIEGELIGEFLKNNNKTTNYQIIKKILEQLRTLDSLGLNKKELTNPYKHILITKKQEPVLIDFERSKKTVKPSNITQFTQYIIRMLVHDKKNIDVLRSLAKNYKSKPTAQNYKKLVATLAKVL